MCGGAGCGKSVLANYIRAELAFRGYNIELVSEAIKDWTFIPRIPTDCDSFYLQATQIQWEDIRLRGGVDLIVSDSPLILQYFYAYYHKVPLQDPMLQAALEYEEIYPSIHIMLQREDKFYDELGRYETLEQAKNIDKMMLNTLKHYRLNYVEFSCLDKNSIINYLVDELGER